MPFPFPGRPPHAEQLFKKLDLEAAVNSPADPNPLMAYPLLDMYICNRCQLMVDQLSAEGVPVLVAHELYYRMRRMGQVSAMAMHHAIWRGLLPVTDANGDLRPSVSPEGQLRNEPPPA